MNPILILGLLAVLSLLMMSNWGAIIGAVIGAAGAIKASDDARDAQDAANRVTEADKRTGLGWIDAAEAQINSEFFRAEEMFRRRLQLTASAAQAEQMLVSNQGNAAIRAIERRESEQLGEMRSNMQRRGLGSSTVGTSLERGIRSDTNDSLLDLSERTTAQQANTLRYGTASTAGAMADLANVGLSRQGAVSQNLAARLNLLQGFQVGYDPSSYAAEAQAWGNLGGAIAAWGSSSSSEDDDKKTDTGSGT